MTGRVGGGYGGSGSLARSSVSALCGPRLGLSTTSSINPNNAQQGRVGRLVAILFFVEETDDSVLV